MNDRRILSSVQDAMFLTFASASASGLNMLASYALAYVMGPDRYGEWQVLVTILWYATVMDLGINIGIARDIPVLLGSGDGEGYRKTAGTVFVWNLGYSVVAAIGLAVYAMTRPAGHYLRAGLPILAVFLIVVCMTNYLQNMLHSHQGLKLWSTVTLLRSVLRLALSLLLWPWGPGALAAGWIAAEVPVFFFIRGCAPHIRYHAGFAPEVFRRLAGLGVPSFLLTLAYWQARIGDRAIVGFYLGERALGLYSVASMFGSFLVMMASQISQTMHPRILRAFGASGDPKAVREHVLAPCEAVSSVFPAVAAAAFFGGPALVETFLPAYAACVPALRVLAVSSFFLAVPQTQGTLLLALEKQWFNLGIWSCVLVVNFGLNAVFLMSGFGMTGVALAMGLSWIVSFVLLFALTLPVLVTKREGWLIVARMLRPFSFGLGLLAAGYGLRFFLQAGPMAVESAGALVFAIGYAPVLASANRRYRVIASVADYIRVRRVRPV